MIKTDNKMAYRLWACQIQKESKGQIIFEHWDYKITGWRGWIPLVSKPVEFI